MLKTNNLVSAYRFENSGTCWAASGRDITVYGAAYADGKFGRCLSFDGVDDYGQFSSAYTFDVNHTICMWIKFNEVNSRYFLGSTGNPGLQYNGSFFYVYANASGYTTLTWYNTSNWIHLTIIHYSAKIYNFYVNGVLIGSCDSNSTSNIAFTYVGRRGDGRYCTFDLSEFQIYNTKLSTENIRRVMHGFHPL